MSLETRVRDLATRIATEVNSIRTEGSSARGTLTSLSTTDKTSLVAAINELFGMVGGASAINDAVTATSSGWSSTKTSSEISTALAALVDSAPGTLDTLGELATALQGNDTDIAGILTAQANRVRVDTNAQGLSGAQKTNARTNIGAQDAALIGNTDRDFTADFTGGLA